MVPTERDHACDPFCLDVKWNQSTVADWFDIFSFVQYSMGGVWIHAVGLTSGQGSGFMTGRLLAGVPGLSAYSNQ